MSKGVYARPRASLRKRGNPNWGKACASVPDNGTVFGSLVEREGLTGKPELWQFSNRLKIFAKKYRASRYVPEFLLEQWGWQDDEVISA